LYIGILNPDLFIMPVFAIALLMQLFFYKTNYASWKSINHKNTCSG